MKPIKLKMRVTKQYDGHGCGYCAMSSIYRFYGLDPRKEKLRARLGTDNALLPDFLEKRLNKKYKRTSKGTLPFDMLAVLVQDGFAIDWVIRKKQLKELLRRHLASGHPALALIDGIAHWILIAGMDDDGVLVLDSLGYADPDGKEKLRYRLSHEDFEAMATGIIMVKPRKRVRSRKVVDLEKIWDNVTVWLGL